MQILKIGSKGTQVMEIQALLNKLGYDVGVIDGIYGPKTAAAVQKFQRYFRLPPTGTVADDTYRIMNQFLLGYDTYRIIPGDTLYSIAKKYYTTVSSIIAANPEINPKNLEIGNWSSISFLFASWEYANNSLKFNLSLSKISKIAEDKMF